MVWKMSSHDQDVATETDLYPLKNSWIFSESSFVVTDGEDELDRNCSLGRVNSVVKVLELIFVCLIKYDGVFL